MARLAAAVSVFTVLLLGATLVTDDPGMLLTLVGAALCALGCAGSGRASATQGPAALAPRAGVPLVNGIVGAAAGQHLAVRAEYQDVHRALGLRDLLRQREDRKPRV